MRKKWGTWQSPGVPAPAMGWWLRATLTSSASLRVRKGHLLDKLVLGLYRLDGWSTPPMTPAWDGGWHREGRGSVAVCSRLGRPPHEMTSILLGILSP